MFFDKINLPTDNNEAIEDFEALSSSNTELSSSSNTELSSIVSVTALVEVPKSAVSIMQSSFLPELDFDDKSRELFGAS